MFLLWLKVSVTIWTAVSFTTAHQYFTIVPNDVSDGAATDCIVQQCYSIQDVIDNSARFFGSNTTIVFLPGYHRVNGNDTMILVKDVKNLAITGYESATGAVDSVIDCRKGKLGFTFYNATNLRISDLNFTFCGASLTFQIEELLSGFYWYRASDIFVILTTFSYKVNIIRTNIDFSEGNGLMTLNVYDELVISRSTLSNNMNNCVVMVIRGNGTYFVTHHYFIVNSQFLNGMTDLEDTRFAAGISVAFDYNLDSAFSLRIINVVVHNNSARHGNLFLYSWSNIAVEIDGLISTMARDNQQQLGLVLILPLKVYWIEAIYVKNSIFENNCIFYRSAALVNLYLTNVTVHKTHCPYGAALFINATQVNEQEKAYMYNQKVYIENLQLYENAGLLLYIENCYVSVSGSNVFKNNGEAVFEKSTVSLGDGVFILSSTVSVNGSIEFLNNTAREGNTLTVFRSELVVKGSLVFKYNIAENCGGLAAQHSILFIKGKLLFIGNEGSRGGAMTMSFGSVIDASCNSTIQIVRNKARQFGGGIYIHDGSYFSYTASFHTSSNTFTHTCFFKTLRKNNCSTVYLKNNVAEIAGSALYGGWLTLCYPELYEFKSDKNDLSVVSSEPFRVCLCIDSIPNCTIVEHTINDVRPGQTLQISAVAVGLHFGTVPTIVRPEFVGTNNSGKVEQLQYFQNTEKVCKMLNYTIRSSNSMEKMRLVIDTVNSDFVLVQLQVHDSLLFEALSISITLKACALGFVFDWPSSTCICHSALKRHEIECNINNNSVSRQSGQWINTTISHNSTDEYGILIHNHCPYDYCKSYELMLHLEQPDQQCSFHRTGILCGGCQQNLSQVLGTSQCKPCSNLWVLALVPTIAFAGVALVIALIVLNLTVSVGTINGLIFYANIVRANHAVFFPPQTTNSFLSWFIAWLNLDLGIEICFYNGMDAYTKTWLQFVFPLYVWVIVTIIIVSSHYFTTAAKLSGRNAVQVLATLFLVSYAKLLRITITAFSSTVLTYPDGYNRRVWLYDGNVDYLSGKHIPLFVAGLLLLIFLSLPYTALLLSIQWLQLRSKYRVLSLVHRLKPLLDAHTGPYKNKHRYWTGLLLLVRVGLFIVFSANVFGDPMINILAILVTIFCLFTYLVFTGGIYKMVLLNFLEYSFLLNLGVLSAATLYALRTKQDQVAVMQTSVGIAFISFIAIVLGHAFLKLASFQWKGRDYLMTKFEVFKLFFSRSKPKTNTHHVTEPETASQQHQTAPTTTFIDIHEPLLDSPLHSPN